MSSLPPDDCAEVASEAPRPGDILAGKYRIEGIVGVGGMAYVLAAWHLHLDERVAIKMPRQDAVRGRAEVARFLREARASAKLRSEHVIRVLDVGEVDQTPYIVMEYLEGSDLAQVLEREGPLPIALVVEYVLQACLALAEAHAMQIVHRDLKPSNLFLVRRPDGRPRVKVVDFGISKILRPLENDGVAMTKTSTTIGTPLYMSPEQLRSSKNVDTRTDIWALGVILFELLSGRPPFVAGSLAELGAQVLIDDAPDLRTRVPDAPPELAAAVAACLRKDVEERTSSVGILATALAPFGADGAVEMAEMANRILREVGPASTPKTFATTRSAAPATLLLQSARSQGPLADATWPDAASVQVTVEDAAPPALSRLKGRHPGHRALTVGAVAGVAVVVLCLALIVGLRSRNRPTPAKSTADAVGMGPASAAPPASSQPPPMPPPVSSISSISSVSSSDSSLLSKRAPPPAGTGRVDTRHPTAVPAEPAILRSGAAASSAPPSPRKALDGFSPNRHD